MGWSFRLEQRVTADGKIGPYLKKPTANCSSLSIWKNHVAQSRGDGTTDAQQGGKGKYHRHLRSYIVRNELLLTSSSEATQIFHESQGYEAMLAFTSRSVKDKGRCTCAGWSDVCSSWHLGPHMRAWQMMFPTVSTIRRKNSMKQGYPSAERVPEISNPF
jgi:hypothetical protein